MFISKVSSVLLKVGPDNVMYGVRRQLGAHGISFFLSFSAENGMACKRTLNIPARYPCTPSVSDPDHVMSGGRLLMRVQELKLPDNVLL